MGESLFFNSRLKLCPGKEFVQDLLQFQKYTPMELLI